MNTLASEVLHQLNQGKAGALPGKLLAQRLGLKDTRPVRLAIIELIETGYPIVGDSGHGYFIAETPEEVKECLDRLMSYLRMIARHHKYLLKASRSMRGQLIMKF